MLKSKFFKGTFMKSFFIGLFCLHSLLADPFVTVKLSGRLGNQLFEIATAYAYALDHDLPLIIPDLIEARHDDIPHNAQALFLHKIDSTSPLEGPIFHWREPSFNYHPIPESESIALYGYFQSEKYFAHRKEEIVELFAPPPAILKKILSRYPFLRSAPHTVGIQIRDYRHEQPEGRFHPTLGRSYYEHALQYFSEGSLFIVSSNNIPYAKECLKGLVKDVIYLSEKDYIEEFYILSLCHNLITSNSSFGWWASWLCPHEDKVLIAPARWFAPPYDNAMMTKDIYPENCIVIDD